MKVHGWCCSAYHVARGCIVLRVVGTNTASDALGKASRKHVQMRTYNGNLLELVSMTAFFSAKALRSGSLKAWCSFLTLKLHFLDNLFHFMASNIIAEGGLPSLLNLSSQYLLHQSELINLMDALSPVNLQLN